MVRKIEVLMMFCMLIGIAGGVGLNHLIRTHRGGGTELRINTPPAEPKPEMPPAGTTNAAAATADTAMNSN